MKALGGNGAGRVAIRPGGECSHGGSSVCTPTRYGLLAGRCRQGPAAPGFEVTDVLPRLAAEAIATIAVRVGCGNSSKPVGAHRASPAE